MGVAVSRRGGEFEFLGYVSRPRTCDRALLLSGTSGGGIAYC